MNTENVRFSSSAPAKDVVVATACRAALGLDGRGARPTRARVARFPSVWETVVMAKRSLRTLKRVSNIPSLGICESCHMQFSADPRQLGQAGVQRQFNAHKCEAMQNAAPSTKDAAKKEAVKKEAVKVDAR